MSVQVNNNCGLKDSLDMQSLISQQKKENKPSDKPTIVLSEINPAHAKNSDVTFDDFPNTTVLGLDDDPCCDFGNTTVIADMGTGDDLGVDQNIEPPASVHEDISDNTESKKPCHVADKISKTQSVIDISRQDMSQLANNDDSKKKEDSVSHNFKNLSQNIASKFNNVNNSQDKPTEEKKSFVTKTSFFKKDKHKSNAASTKFKLVRLSTDEEIVPEGKSFVIGKSKFSNYQIKGNNTVSRSHVVLSVEDDGSVLIVDKDSKNGTSVDGVYLKPEISKAISAGQTIRMSDEEFLVKRI